MLYGNYTSTEKKNEQKENGFWVMKVNEREPDKRWME